jgi:hypothetical protein
MQRPPLPRGSLAAILTVVLSACAGNITGGDELPDGFVPPDGPRFARLTHAQWENTVQDLFELAAPPGLAGDFPPDPPLGRFDNNVARLTITGGHWRDYQRAAEIMAGRVIDDPAIYAVVVPADRPADDATAARLVIETFGRRAFRRPLEAAELDRLAALFTEGPTHYPQRDPFAAGVQLVVETILQSPHFLYRAELSAGDGGPVVALSDHEIAARLAYALTNSMPDRELDRAADAGELRGEGALWAQAERLFDAGRTRAQIEHFHFQAFALREYTDLDKDGALFPDWRPELGVAMQRETTRFLDEQWFADGTIADLFTSTRSFVDAGLAAVYGVEGEFGAELVAVELDPTQRAGLLTRAGFLAKNATLRDPDPIHRGVAINLEILCRELDTVPALPDDLSPTGDTNRERVESISGVGTCGEGCHASVINPPGYALEHYDALGRWRDEDNGFPVNAADAYTFPDGRTIQFKDGVELSRKLAAAPEVHACYLRQVLEYVHGRDLGAGDEALLAELAAASLAEDLTIRELVLRAVTSPAFRYRAAR